MATISGRLMNAMPALILRSPLHPMMSGKYAIFEFTGRKSGRNYATPIAYVRDGDRILLSTDSPWWKNLVGGAPVRIRLRGHEVTGVAAPVTEPAEAAAILRKLVTAVPSYSKPAGLQRLDGVVPDSEIDRAIAEGRVSIEVTLGESQ